MTQRKPDTVIIVTSYIQR